MPLVKPMPRVKPEVRRQHCRRPKHAETVLGLRSEARNRRQNAADGRGQSRRLEAESEWQKTGAEGGNRSRRCNCGQ